jgi:anti-sigma B factor antagonist
MTPENTREISDGMLAVRIVENGAERRVVLRGELDLANAATAEAQLDEAVANGAPVVIDLRQLEFIDSTGIALLVRAIQADGDAPRLSFVPSEFDAVNKVLDLTGVGERMALADGSGSN